ncbi:L-aspartate oxidase [Microbacterium sp. G2-8]|uniref:L-aspartate oxidase n=1 Tax=Microbacterium sp. G2-8 TaxID=2842454 RepID=UPI001C897961|nr:L-aspartate oxidase [Microbacterium sp. G2-8]
MIRVIVVGSGIAGLTAALHARESGADVTVITKDRAACSNTAVAQGGIAGVVFPDDAHELHARDTIRAGGGLGDPAAVHALVTDGTARIAELIDRGVHFDRTETGELARGLEGAHSVSRVLHAGGDATGAEIQRALLQAVRAAGVPLLEQTMLADLVADAHGGVVGVATIGHAGARAVLPADAVVIATGGAGRVFARTTNPPIATGDGIAAAIRVGARVRDMEFVQFHPTVLAAGEPFLVSEAVRGEGAVLLDESGHAFLRHRHPDGDLAPRDVVASEIADVVMRQDGRPVLLDATRLGAAFLARRFPTIDRAVRDRGLDWACAPIPVHPAAHYLMGGIAADLDGRTSVPGLLAAGEAACTGVHGANRLASNSLLEGVVFGARAGRAAAASPRASLRSVARAPAPDTATISSTFSRDRLAQLMWTHAGLRRDADGLRRATHQLAEWRRTLPAPHSRTSAEDANLVAVASAIVEAAGRRRSSVGAHVRDDARSSPRSLALETV